VAEQSPIEAARLLFIRRWGEMAASWGISRTMAEIHALLYVASEPLCTDDVMEQLSVSRGSASTNLRQLVNWGLIHRSHRRNDRKEYFEAEKDVWQMFETIVRERRRREVQPIVETLQRCLELIEHGPRRGNAESNGDVDAFKRRISNMLEFCEMMNTLFNVISKGGEAGFAPFTKSLAKLVG